jgi:hypothetical protein
LANVSDNQRLIKTSKKFAYFHPITCLDANMRNINVKN